MLTAVAHANITMPEQSLILVGASDGIAYSSDGGATWTAGALREPAQVAQIVVSPTFERDGAAFAATTGHGAALTDGGQSWVPRNFGLADKRSDCHRLVTDVCDRWHVVRRRHRSAAACFTAPIAANRGGSHPSSQKQCPCPASPSRAMP